MSCKCKTNPILNIKKLEDFYAMPKYQMPNDSGMDLYAAESGFVDRGIITKFSTGIALDIPEGYEIQIRSRSGMASKGIVVANSPGTVDFGYNGPIGVLLTSLTGYRTIQVGERIAQMVLAPVAYATLVEVETLQESVRGTNGFGSTDKSKEK